MRNEARRTRLIALVDARETVAQHKHIALRRILVGLPSVAPDHLNRGDRFGIDTPLDHRRLEHAQHVAQPAYGRGSFTELNLAGLNPPQLDEPPRHHVSGKLNTGR